MHPNRDALRAAELGLSPHSGTWDTQEVVEFVLSTVLTLVGAVVGVEYGRWRARQPQVVTTASEPLSPVADPKRESPKPQSDSSTGSVASRPGERPPQPSVGGGIRTLEDYGRVGAFGGAFAGLLSGPVYVWMLGSDPHV